ncbi:oligosaccharide flippase family protein [Vibrio cortegadensis]|uniref:oligosaccharide flippase family protein n=1 Tax=Vibrio cortegadensis TaxID=1328770 RepID=UPI0021C32535|nr:oligosaccharide flippase family protein [Vibrio cortegadensis]MDN3697720.1 oligosaccharide flippase family protein [Vibrio cortegadensis]
MNHFKRFFLYGVGTLGARLINFIIFPLFTFYLTPEELGAYDLTLTLSFVFVSIVSLQVGDAAYRFILKKENYDPIIIISNVYAFLMISAFICSVLVVLILFLIEMNNIFLIVLVLLTCLMLNVLRQIIRGLGDVKLFAISGIVYSFSFLAFNFIFLYCSNLKLEGVLLSFTLANVSSILIILLGNRRTTTIELKGIDIKVIKKLISFSLPLVPNHISWWLINAANRFVLLFYVGVEMVGLYAVAAKFAAVMLVFNGLFALVWQDKVLIDDYESKSEYSSNLRNYVYFQLGIVCVFLFCSQFVYAYFIGEQFSLSQKYIPFLLIAAFFSSLSSFYGAILLKLEDTKAIFKSSLFAGGGSIVAVIILVQNLGVLGAAIAEVLGFFIMALLRHWRLRHEIDISLFQLGLVISSILLMFFFI